MPASRDQPMNSDHAYPLRWPKEWPRTKVPGKSAFQPRTVHQAMEDLEFQLKRLGATNVVVSSNVTLGAPPADKGVCVYFRLRDRPYALPCDKWASSQENIWALAKHIEGLRASERWGVGTVERVFEGYAALPPPGSSAGGSWWDVLQCDSGAKFEDAKQAYRTLARTRHPDNGGSNDAMVQLNTAWDQARKHFGQ